MGSLLEEFRLLKHSMFNVTDKGLDLLIEYLKFGVVILFKSSIYCLEGLKGIPDEHNVLLLELFFTHPDDKQHKLLKGTIFQLLNMKPKQRSWPSILHLMHDTAHYLTDEMEAGNRCLWMVGLHLLFSG